MAGAVTETVAGTVAEAVSETAAVTETVVETDSDADAAWVPRPRSRSHDLGHRPTAPVSVTAPATVPVMVPARRLRLRWPIGRLATIG